MATDVSMHHNAESASVLSVSLASLAKMIDHSLLHPTMTDTEIMTGLDIAKAYRAATVCVKPYATALASRELQGTGVLVCTVIGFPHGNSTPAIKVLEAKEAVELGAKEIDMVINIGKALSGDWDYVTDEIRQINDAVTNLGATLKVIFENDYLDDSHIIKLCQICSDIDVAFVKTSTGYGFVKRSTGQYSYDGATAHHLKLMREHCKSSVQIKAAGGVRTVNDLLYVMSLGVTRVGATATVDIIKGARLAGIGYEPVTIDFTTTVPPDGDDSHRVLGNAHFQWAVKQ